MGVRVELCLYETGGAQACTNGGTFQPACLHAINALGNALAEAKEKLAAGKGDGEQEMPDDQA